MAPSRRKHSPGNGQHKSRVSRRGNLAAAQRQASKPAGRPHRGGPERASNQEAESNSTETPRPKTYRDARALVNAIFQKHDPIETAGKLLTGAADSTAAKIWALLLEYRYGKPVQHLEAQGADGAPVTMQLVTTVPRPLREYESGAVIEAEES